MSESAEQLLIRAERARSQVAGDPAAGLRTAEQVAQAAREGRMFEALIVALCAAGWAARETYAHDAALHHLDEAVRVARRQRLEDHLAEALVARAGVHLEFGHTARATRDVTAARAAATVRTRAEVEFAEALLQSFRGNPAGAAAAYRRALRFAEPDQRRVRLRALHNLGLVEVRRGRHDEAGRLLDQAAELAAIIDATAASAVIASSQALAASERGDPITALRRFDDAEAMMATAGLPQGEMLADKASALLALRLLDEAARSVRRAVREFAAADGRALMLADALLLQARVEVARGQFEDAAAAASQAEELLRRQRRHGWRAHATLLRLSSEAAAGGGQLTATVERKIDRVERTLAAMGHLQRAVEAGLLAGRLALERQRPRRARHKLRRVTEMAKNGPVLVRVQGRTAAALLADAERDHRRLGQICQHGLADLARYRATFASAELRARAASYGDTLAGLGLRAAVRSGRVESVWCWLERGRAVAFVRAEQDADESIEPQLAALRQLERDLDTANGEDPLRSRELLRSINKIERRIRHATWARERTDAQWTLPTVERMRAVRSALADRALLQYGILDGHVVGVTVTAGRMAFARLGPVEQITAAGQQLAFALRRLARPGSPASVTTAFGSARTELDQLGRRLVAPLLQKVDSAREVIVVPPVELVGIPWGALPTLADAAVRVSPSATAWHMTSGSRRASDRIVAIAGPDLTGAEEEVAHVASCHGSVVRLAGPAASCGNVLREVAGAALVHVACHGRLRTDSPTFSSLRLDDGPLTVHDLERLAEPAHHWILAACDLGATGRLAGSELEGVLAALLFGGAAGVVAAVVSVPDIATLDYMGDMHRALAQGQTLADAVHHARTNRDMADPAEFVTSVAFSCYGGG